jgi:hypothetical protein
VRSRSHSLHFDGDGAGEIEKEIAMGKASRVKRERKLACGGEAVPVGAQRAETFDIFDLSELVGLRIGVAQAMFRNFQEAIRKDDWELAKSLIHSIEELAGGSIFDLEVIGDLAGENAFFNNIIIFATVCRAQKCAWELLQSCLLCNGAATQGWSDFAASSLEQLPEQHEGRVLVARLVEADVEPVDMKDAYALLESCSSSRYVELSKLVRNVAMRYIARTEQAEIQASTGSGQKTRTRRTRI